LAGYYDVAEAMVKRCVYDVMCTLPASVSLKRKKEVRRSDFRQADDVSNPNLECRIKNDTRPAPRPATSTQDRDKAAAASFAITL